MLVDTLRDHIQAKVSMVRIQAKVSMVKVYTDLGDARRRDLRVGERTARDHFAKTGCVLAGVFKKDLAHAGKLLARELPVQFQGKTRVLVNRLESSSALEPNPHLLEGPAGHPNGARDIAARTLR